MPQFKRTNLIIAVGLKAVFLLLKDVNELQFNKILLCDTVYKWLFCYFVVIVNG